MDVLKIGQIWKENDLRTERFIRVESIGTGRRNVGIRTVVNVDGVWQPSQRSRLSYADGARFDGRSTGYSLHDAANT